MANNPILSATLQASLLGILSNLLAQTIESHRKQEPLRVNWIPVFQFLLFSIISTPPNFIWLAEGFPIWFIWHTIIYIRQRSLESAFPARTAPPNRLDVRNTLLKFALDQTLGAVFNALLFSVYFHSIRMAMRDAKPVTSFPGAIAYWISPGVIDFSAVDVSVVLGAAFGEFWTIMLAGVRVWPVVSLVNYTLVKTVEGRNLVGCVAGLGWGVYMSMIAAK